MLRNRRLLNFAGAFICAALMAYALYAEKVLGLAPCPLCMFQRVGITALGVVFLLAALHHPRALGARLYGVLLVLAGTATMYIAGRHVWIQAQPPGTVPACGAPLELMMEMFPLLEVVRKVLTGGGECGAIDWTFLGLSMPAWVLIAAIGLTLGGVLNNFGNARSRKQVA
jgi:disulfide bond formation protein DsbB